MLIDSLRDKAVDLILSSENVKEAMGSLWMIPEFVPQLIRERQKTAKNLEDKLLFSFNRKILIDIWGCPDIYIDEIADDSDINDLLDKIIYRRRFDILNTPLPILELIDQRDHEICDTKKYKSHFNSKFSLGFINETPQVRILEGTQEKCWRVDTHNLHEPISRCDCGSKHYDNKCACDYVDGCICMDSDCTCYEECDDCHTRFTGFNCPNCNYSFNSHPAFRRF